jgi:hypothetical protein
MLSCCCLQDGAIKVARSQNRKTVGRLQVKDLLESGHTLHGPLFGALVSRVAAVVAATGMTRYNFFLLPIFTFVRKCCGVGQADLDAALARSGLTPLVYAPANAAPRPYTPLTPTSRPSTKARPVRRCLARVTCSNRLC